ncbi:rhodanese-like domain-containing protein [Bacillus sp. BRMEA1]|uniref:rhodanese-like domain-containing protein n=1 Tax=Neobacillus endophyticus TaxID=2738405 RepID=UPI0015633133|nr:rhodanese-like domain-containing protein [Neobacillus endophyticus]NRD77944.1 rhodanese-like domain-containing protein [Neobacillus endophyticus]
MTVKKIIAKELYERIPSSEKTFVLDVRAEEKYNEFHIEAAQFESHNIPKTVIFELDELGENQVSLPKDKEIIVTCTTGNSAAKCAEILDRLNFNVKVLEGGVTAWKEYIRSINK